MAKDLIEILRGNRAAAITLAIAMLMAVGTGVFAAICIYEDLYP